jgi:FlaA1/EpsC-like NDP-sugar epimerase
MRRYFTRASQIAIDLIVLCAAFAVAFLVRFDGLPPAPMTGRLLLTGPYVVAFEYFMLVMFGIHRFVWRYVGLREAQRIFSATASATALLVLVRIGVGQLQVHAPYLRHGVLPFGVIGINFALAFLFVGGVRIGRRLLGERLESERKGRSNRPESRTMLVGAGQAGVLVARELLSRPDLGMRAVGFLDDAPSKVGMVVHGIPVLGSTAELPELCIKHDAQQVLITIASAPGKEIRRIRRLCEEAGIPTKIIPGLYEIVGGKVNLSRIRNIAIEDLLRRDQVDLDLDSIAETVRDRVVMTTGAGGSIGSELCRQLCRFQPAALILVERAENALFNIHRELAAAHPEVRLVPCIADTTDEARMDELFSTHSPAVVLHAAAHKHVPMMEWNPVEAVKNNVFGTRIVADLSSRYGVTSFVMISTDKAVNPTSVMGAAKRAAEIYVQALSQRSKTRFVTVRFGNVLGSAGSVIPIFQEQIARGGPVTVTHSEMRRYFMTIPEACQLVLEAGSMGRGGEIFILDMGEPVRIVDLARDLIALSGLREGEDIEIVFSGVRPGEKLFEELSADAEMADKTRHPKIFVGRIQPQKWETAMANLELLQRAIVERSAAAAGLALRSVVPEYGSPPVPPPQLVEAEGVPELADENDAFARRAVAH